MAAFTSAQTGDWNDGATWGNSSPGVKGTDWPGAAGDTATIANTHVVTYNVEETNQLGTINIQAGGELTFATNMDTLLSIATGNNFSVSGTLKIGTISSPIDASYTAKILFYSASTTYEFFCYATGSFHICGDPDFYGDEPEAVLQANWTTGQTFTVVGDLTSSWSSGQELLLVKDGEYSALYTDPQIVTIDSIAANGDNTDITIVESFPTGSYSAGATVWHLSRNVIFSMNGSEDISISAPGTSCGEFEAYEPGTNEVERVIHSALINNTYCAKLYRVQMDNSIIARQYATPYFTAVDGDNNLILCAANSTMRFNSCNIRNWTLMSTYAGPIFYGCMAKNFRVVCEYTGYVPYAVRGSFLEIYSYKFRGDSIYAGFAAPYSSCSIVTGAVGENENGLSYYVNDQFGRYITSSEMSFFLRIKNLLFSGTPTFYGSNSVSNGPQGLFIESMDGTNSDPQYYGTHAVGTMVTADGSGSEPSQRSGGSSEVWKIEFYSNINAALKQKAPIEIEYYVGSSQTLTFNIYMQTDYSSVDMRYIMTAIHPDLMEIDWGTIATRSSQSDWSQKASVTMTFSNPGWVKIWIFEYAYDYESSKYLWIDPLVEVV